MIINYLKNRKKHNKWHELNAHNETYPINNFNYENVVVGNYTYGELTVLNFNTNEKLYIGHFCSIASGVVFSLNAEHSIENISTYPFKVKCLQNEQYEAGSKGDIVVGDDVWIGQNAIILSGVKIGQGAVIGAGAVVCKDVEPYSIVGGVPAKFIKYRFEEEVRNELLKIDYSKLTKEIVEKNIDLLYQKPVDVQLVKKFVKELNNG